MDIIQEETFGPVLPVVEFTEVEDAIAWANDCEYGLTSSIYTPVSYTHLGYIVLKLNAEGESTIDIPAGCTVRIIKKIGKKPLVLREQGGYSFRLKD